MGKNIRQKANIFKGKSNPFNIKLNRQKHEILGKKAKGTQGLRGISRAASHAKRKEHYLKTKLHSEKANHFLDKRIMDGSIPAEERMVNRLIKERKWKLKKSKFNLNDEEDLTHKGMPLHEVKKTDGKESDSEDEDNLDANFVSKVHFGGFDTDKQEKLSHKEIIDKLIVDSKQKKLEKRIEKEINTDLTEKLDQEWKANLALLACMNRDKNEEPAPKISKDPYDIVVETLKLETVLGAASVRTKTAEELEQEEKERNLKLEKERVSRMYDDSDNVISKRVMDHLSADSIIDDFDLEPIPVVVDDDDKRRSVDNEAEYSDSEQSAGSSGSESEDEEDATGYIKSVPDIIRDDDSLGIPGTLEKFEEILEDAVAKDLSKVIDDILKPFLKAKSDNNMHKLGIFFGILLEYSFKNLKNIDIPVILVPHLHTIAGISELGSGKKFLSLLDQEQQLFQTCKGLKKKKDFPRLESLILLKYCSVIYSVSDFRHPVVTPATLYMSDILSSPFQFTLENIVSRLFVCSIVLDVVSCSKRIVPEAVTFLSKILGSAVLDEKTDMVSSKNKKFSLVLIEDSSTEKIKELNFLHLNKSMCINSTKLGVIFKTVKLLQKFAGLYTQYPSYAGMFLDTLAACSKLPTDKYPTELAASVAALIDQIESKTEKLQYLKFVNTKPKLLKFFEPKFESKFTKNKEDVGKKFKLLKNVSQKIRKEERGLLREMRRDVQVVAAEKLSAQLESDAERKRKVKELYHDLSVQEGEYKKLMRTKK